MNLLRKILFPFAVLYGAVTQFRNLLFDQNILTSHSFDVPVIAVGNLSVGGTGKTPQIEYLIRLLLPHYRVATLSRGYKRKSKGYILADSSATAEVLGDEPFQFYRKFPSVKVAVDANRVNGLSRLLMLDDRPDVILLDDAFQHRQVKAGFYILLTTYADLYADDFLLPTGNLRESRKGAARADVIIVTKCPPHLDAAEQQAILQKLDINQNQQLFFSYIGFADVVYSEAGQLDVLAIKPMKKVLLAGIARPEPFFEFLQHEQDILLKYPDHHFFSEKELLEIRALANDKLIITTEKDYVRLQGLLAADKLYYLPIQSEFIAASEQFDNTILNYVGTSTGNRSVS
jgi:tetraacyldisaccharide 4'-kinase